MKVTEHIEKAKGNTLFSFEIIPPKKGKNIQELYNNIDVIFLHLLACPKEDY